MGILPLIRDGHPKVHLNNPSKRFVEMIRQHLDPRQVTSLHINNDPLKLRSDLSVLWIFDQLSSLTVSRIGDLLLIYHCLYHLHHVRRLSLWFKDQLNYSYFYELANLSYYKITHLHIHCAGRFFDLNCFEGDSYPLVKNSMVTSFILDLDYCPLRQTTHVSSRNALLFINLVFKFIKSLLNLRRLRLIITRDHLQPILYMPRWQHLISECLHLNRVFVQLMDHEDSGQEATTNLEKELRQLRPEMIFRMQTVKFGRMFSLPL
jgi:hypothetical protein